VANAARNSVGVAFRNVSSHYTVANGIQQAGVVFFGLTSVGFGPSGQRFVERV